MIFPLVLLFLLLLISLSLIQFQMSTQFYKTTLTADRLANNWQVPAKLFETGEYLVTDARVSLYSQLQADSLVFNLLSLTKLYEAEYYSKFLAGNTQAHSFLDEFDQTNIYWETKGLSSIHVKSVDRMKGLLLTVPVLDDTISVSSYSTATDPADFIRVVDLLHDK